MTTKKIPFNYDINRMLAVDLIAIIHIEDYDTRFLELTMFDDGTPFSVDGCIVTSRFVTISGSYLLSDNVPCEATGNTITIPIDAAAVQMMACDIKIEVNIVDGEKILTLPFPLWVRVRGSILEVAHVTPESEGTIPELLEAVKEELERVQGYVDEEQVKNIIDGVLSGVTTNVPTLLIDNTVNQQYNPDGHLIWYYIDSDGARHNLFDFTPYLGGTDDYNDLNNKPQISGVTLSGDKTPDELGLQKKLTAGDNVTIDENGVISAEGGTDDYNDLENKPQFNVANAPDGWGINIPVQGVIELMTFYLQSDQNNRKVLRIKDNAIVFSMLSSALQKEMFKDYGIAQEIPTDFFTNSSSAPSTNGLWLINKTDLSGMPIPAAGYLFNFICGVTRIQFYLTDYYNDLDEQFRLFFRTQYMGGFNKWVELTGGGFQIASAVVNQNGTISFYDADGNLLFTTTGASVIGPQGAPGQDYVLTPQDKTDIANIVLQELPTTEGVLYGD